MSLVALALSATLLKGDLPLAERVAKLAPFFSPKPGQVLELDPTERRDLGTRIKPGKLRGQITVSPPKGVCFTIQRLDSESDDVVCKRQVLTFSYDHLDKNGRLNWKVGTGEGDFGTALSWQSPYRVAIVTPFDKELSDPPEYRYIDRCEAVKDDNGRRIVLGLASGERWVIRFPAKDELLPQPDPPPNLFMTTAQGRISVKDAAQNKKAEGSGHGSEPPKEGEPPAEGAPPAPPPPPAPPNELEDRGVWSIPLRNSYQMASSNFQPFGSVAPGGRGSCRYNFDGPEEDPTTGRIECHDVDGFKAVFVPLTCLRGIR